MKENSKNTQKFLFFDAHTHQTSTEGVVSLTNASLMQTAPQGYFSAGIHPWWIVGKEPDFNKSLEWIRSLTTNKHMLALGECGLDLLKSKNTALQLMWFKEHLTLAAMYELPVILHLVKADHLALALIDEYKDVVFIYHGFSGKWSRAEMFVRKNIVLSFGFALFYQEATRDSFRRTPAHLLLLESDNTPQPDMEELYNEAAKLRGMSFEDFYQLIKNNFTNTFKRYGQSMA